MFIITDKEKHLGVIEISEKTRIRKRIRNKTDSGKIYFVTQKQNLRP